MNPKVDTYLNKIKAWSKETQKLREIILECALSEELKWGKPCYTLQGKNIVLIMGLKEHCVLLFFKGALLNDPNDILTKAGENTQAARQLRLTSLQEIIELKPILKAYIQNAIDVEKSGQEIIFKKLNEFIIPKEFQQKLDGNLSLKSAFKVLTPGRQRAYIMYFSAAKQSKTRVTRIEKCIPLILQGKGLNDEYQQIKA